MGPFVFSIFAPLSATASVARKPTAKRKWDSIIKGATQRPLLSPTLLDDNLSSIEILQALLVRLGGLRGVRQRMPWSAVE